MLNILKIIANKQNFSLVKPYKIGNEAGKTKHYPPANKEWFNSIYAFNKNTVKSLPIADKVILNIVKSYFNLYSRRLEVKSKFAPIRTRFRRLSVNRMLVSRAELKHTSNKVTVTVYVYNRQNKYYTNKMFRISSIDLYLRKPSYLKKLKLGITSYQK